MIIGGIAWGVIFQVLLATLGGGAVLILAYRALLFLLKGKPDLRQYASMERIENPVRGVVSIEYQLPEPGKVEMQLLDSELKSIRQLFEGEMEEGEHVYSFDSSSVNDGEYNYKLITHNQSMVKKIIVRNKA